MADREGRASRDEPGTGVHGKWRARFVEVAGWALAIAVFLIAFVHLIGSLALIDPDEGRNAEVAREMAETGDFIVPHLNGLPYLDKPILFFSAAAVSIRALGPTELAARLPAFLFTLATLLLVMAFGWRRFDRETGLLAALMLATSPIVLAYSGIVIFDAPMMFLVTLASISFHLALESERPWWCLTAWAAAGLAALTKGPVGLVLPLLIGLGDALASRRPPGRLFHPAGMGLFLLLVGPWFLAVTLRQPEFPHYAFVRETFERVATDSMRRTAPFYYFLPILLGGAFPWALLLLAGGGRLVAFWRDRLRGARDEAFLIVWLVLPTLFFTLSQSKRPGYILPVIPAVALLGARICRTSPRDLRAALWIAAPVAAGVGTLLLLAGDRVANRIEAARIADALLAAAPSLGMALLLAAGFILLGLRWHRLAPVGLALAPVILLLGSQGVLMQFGEQRSSRELAQAIREAVPDQARVIGVDAFPPSLPFYLGDKVTLATADAIEMRSNYIRDYLDALRARPDSPLRPRDWWREELARCPDGTLFVARARRGREATREALSARLPLVYRNHRYAVYGPCGKVPS